MDLCIKTIPGTCKNFSPVRFNPCFNGSMYKNPVLHHRTDLLMQSFNPCFNGSMYKNIKSCSGINIWLSVSILVLMDLCIKTARQNGVLERSASFNPCFNGSMYKNPNTSR